MRLIYIAPRCRVMVAPPRLSGSALRFRWNSALLQSLVPPPIFKLGA